MVKAFGIYVPSRTMKKHLGPSRCGKSHERMLPGSKLPWLASPDTCRHPDECDNPQQALKRPVRQGGACLATFLYTSFAVYYRKQITLCLFMSLFCTFLCFCFVMLDMASLIYKLKVIGNAFH